MQIILKISSKTQTARCVGHAWTARGSLTGAFFHSNSPVIPIIGEQKMAMKSLGGHSGPWKKMYCFSRVNSNSYLPLCFFFMTYRDGLKLLLSWLSNSRHLKCQTGPPCFFFLEQSLKVPGITPFLNRRMRESCWKFNQKKPQHFPPQCSSITINVKLIKTQSKTKRKVRKK